MQVSAASRWRCLCLLKKLQRLGGVGTLEPNWWETNFMKHRCLRQGEHALSEAAKSTVTCSFPCPGFVVWNGRIGRVNFIAQLPSELVAARGRFDSWPLPLLSVWFFLTSRPVSVSFPIHTVVTSSFLKSAQRSMCLTFRLEVLFAKNCSSSVCFKVEVSLAQKASAQV